VLVPAAVSYAIGEQEAAQVTAALIVEAANMPVLPAAEPVLTARGVLVVPDVVANSATNSWWWWTLFGDIEADADAAFAKIRSRMRTWCPTCSPRPTAPGRPPGQPQPPSRPARALPCVRGRRPAGDGRGVRPAADRRRTSDSADEVAGQRLSRRSSRPATQPTK
jgi:hypothetical protein